MDYFKIFTIIFMIIITYLLYNIYCDKIKENFSSAEQSIGGVDDTNAINTLAQLAKQLMAGGATVPGNLSIKGEIDATGGIKAGGRNILAELDKLNARWDGDTLIAAGGIHLANKWGLYDTGDDWIRVNNIKARGTNDYRGGVAVANLWSRDTQYLPQYVRFNQNVSARPNPDPGRVFDFGSQGRTTVDNGWSIMQLIPR